MKSLPCTFTDAHKKLKFICLFSVFSFYMFLTMLSIQCNLEILESVPFALILKSLYMWNIPSCIHTCSYYSVTVTSHNNVEWGFPPALSWPNQRTCTSTSAELLHTFFRSCFLHVNAPRSEQVGIMKAGRLVKTMENSPRSLSNPWEDTYLKLMVLIIFFPTNFWHK